MRNCESVRVIIQNLPIPYRRRPRLKYTARKHHLPPNPFKRATFPPPPSQPTPTDQVLQGLWQEALTEEESNRLLKPTMEDIVQAAIQETIPEIIKEAQKECIEEIAVQQAGAIMVGIAETAAEEGIVLSQDVQAKIHYTASAAIDIQQRQQMGGSTPPDPTVPEGDQPPEIQQIEPASGEEAPMRGEIEEDMEVGTDRAPEAPQPPVHTEDVTPDSQLGPAATIANQPIEVIAEGRAEEEDDEFDRERWIQGTIAPELSKDAQRKLATKGVFLVVVTRISDENDIFITSIADPPLTIEKQRDIRRRGGQILISLTEDSYDIYQMEVDPSLIPKSKNSKSQKEDLSGTSECSYIQWIWCGF